MIVFVTKITPSVSFAPLSGYQYAGKEAIEFTITFILLNTLLYITKRCDFETYSNPCIAEHYGNVFSRIV